MTGLHLRRTHRASTLNYAGTVSVRLSEGSRRTCGVTVSCEYVSLGLDNSSIERINPRFVNLRSFTYDFLQIIIIIVVVVVVVVVVINLNKLSLKSKYTRYRLLLPVVP